MTHDPVTRNNANATPVYPRVAAESDGYRLVVDEGRMGQQVYWMEHRTMDRMLQPSWRTCEDETPGEIIADMLANVLLSSPPPAAQPAECVVIRSNGCDGQWNVFTPDLRWCLDQTGWRRPNSECDDDLTFGNECGDWPTESAARAALASAPRPPDVEAPQPGEWEVVDPTSPEGLAALGSQQFAEAVANIKPTPPATASGDEFDREAENDREARNIALTYGGQAGTQRYQSCKTEVMAYGRACAARARDQAPARAEFDAEKMVQDLRLRSGLYSFKNEKLFREFIQAAYATGAARGADTEARLRWQVFYNRALAASFASGDKAQRWAADQWPCVCTVVDTQPAPAPPAARGQKGGADADAR